MMNRIPSQQTLACDTNFDAVVLPSEVEIRREIGLT
jgi:hypothetical protein